MPAPKPVDPKVTVTLTPLEYEAIEQACAYFISELSETAEAQGRGKVRQAALRALQKMRETREVVWKP